MADGEAIVDPEARRKRILGRLHDLMRHAELTVLQIEDERGDAHLDGHHDVWAEAGRHQQKAADIHYTLRRYLAEVGGDE